MHNTTLEYAYQLVVLLSTLEYSSSMQQYITLILYIILESRWCVVLYTTYVLVCILESTTSSYSRVVVISIQCLDTIVRMRYYSTSNYYCTTSSYYSSLVEQYYQKYSRVREQLARLFLYMRILFSPRHRCYFDSPLSFPIDSSLESDCTSHRTLDPRVLKEGIIDTMPHVELPQAEFKVGLRCRYPVCRWTCDGSLSIFSAVETSIGDVQLLLGWTLFRFFIDLHLHRPNANNLKPDNYRPHYSG